MTTEATPGALGSNDQLGLVPKRATLGSTIICGVRNPYPRTIAMTLETPASVAYANKLLSRKKSGWRLVSFVAGAAVLTGCVDMVQPPDIAVAEELCAKRGGYAHAQRWERGAVLDVNCKDGTQMNVRLPKKG